MFAFRIIIWKFIKSVPGDRFMSVINQTRALVCATGTHSSPFFPDIPGRCNFLGLQIHSSDYREPSTFLHHKVAVVGEGNSGAQIVAEVLYTRKFKII